MSRTASTAVGGIKPNCKGADVARVTAFGLNMDEELKTEIITALRWAWPDLTAGLSDDRATQVVLKSMFADVLARYRAGQAVPDQQEALREATEAVMDRARNAQDNARTQVADEVQPTAP